MNRNVGFFKSVQFKLIIIYVLLIFITLQIIGVYFTKQLEEQLVANYYELLEERAQLLAYNIAQEMSNHTDDKTALTSNINALLRDIFTIENAEVQVIDQNRVVLSTSNLSNRSIVGQLSTEIRVKRALLGTRDAGNFRDPSTGNRLRVLAFPIKKENETVGALYIEASMEEIYEQMGQINSILISGTFIALLSSAALMILLARTITVPIIDMRRQAMRMTYGDYSKQVKVYGSDEIGQLAMSFNDLAKRLQQVTLTRDREQKRLKSVLTHMTDGVMASDANGRVILLNKRAEDLLNVSSDEVIGQNLQGVLRISDAIGIEELPDHHSSVLLDFSDENEEY